MRNSILSQNKDSIIKQECQQLTLTDIFTVPNNKIHSKKIYSKFNHLRSATSNYDDIHKQIKMMKIKENLAKLSYTIKTIQSREDQIGIKSRRVPLKSKNNQHQRFLFSQRDSRTKSQISYKSVDVFTPPTNNFVSKPFHVIKRSKPIKQRPKSQLQIVSKTLKEDKQQNAQLNSEIQSLIEKKQSLWSLKKSISQTSSKFKILKQMRKNSQNNKKNISNNINSQKILAQIPILKSSQNTKVSYSQYLSRFNEDQIRNFQKKEQNNEFFKKIKIQNFGKGKSNQLIKKIQNWHQAEVKTKNRTENQNKSKETPFRRYNTKKVYQSWIQNRYVKQKYRFWRESRQSNKQN